MTHLHYTSHPISLYSHVYVHDPNIRLTRACSCHRAGGSAHVTLQCLMQQSNRALESVCQHASLQGWLLPSYLLILGPAQQLRREHTFSCTVILAGSLRLLQIHLFSMPTFRSRVCPCQVQMGINVHAWG